MFHVSVNQCTLQRLLYIPESCQHNDGAVFTYILLDPLYVGHTYIHIYVAIFVFITSRYPFKMAIDVQLMQSTSSNKVLIYLFYALFTSKISYRQCMGQLLQVYQWPSAKSIHRQQWYHSPPWLGKG